MQFRSMYHYQNFLIPASPLTQDQIQNKNLTAYKAIHDLATPRVLFSV